MRFLLCKTVCSSGGIEARWVATRLSSCETSSAEAVPTEKRLSNRLEYTFRRLRVVARDAQPILRPENDEVGVRDRGRGHERHHVAIEPARLEKQPSGSRIRGVEPPEVELVARREPEQEAVVCPGSKRPPLGVQRAGAVRARRIGVGIDRWIERGAGNFGLPFRLDDACERRRNVEIPRLRIDREARELR